MRNRPSPSVRTESPAPAESRPIRCSVTQRPGAPALAAPRAIGLDGDRADFRYRVAFDRITGAILAIEELRGERVVRSAVVTSFVADAPIPSAAFDLEIPADAVGIY